MSQLVVDFCDKEDQCARASHVAFGSAGVDCEVSFRKSATDVREMIALHNPVTSVYVPSWYQSRYPKHSLFGLFRLVASTVHSLSHNQVDY